MDSFTEQIWKAVISNLPQRVGAVIAGVVVAVPGWLWARARRRRQRISTSQPETTGSPPSSDLLAAYLNDLIRRGSTLSFGDPASWTVDHDKSIGLVTLEQVWTPLRVADSQTRVGKVGTHESMAEEDVGVGLRELFESTEHPLVILGDPGSGKSTSVAMFAVEYALNWSDSGKRPLPIWVNLGTVANSTQTERDRILLTGVPELEAAVARGGVDAGAELAKLLWSAIATGQALLLLDGLDEVKEHVLPDVRGAITHLVRLRKGTRVIATCRKFDYRQSTPNRKISIDRELELLPYSADEMNLYVDRWYGAAVRIGRFSASQADKLNAALKIELRGKHLAELGSLPLLLALLTLIHSEEAQLPDSKAVVCDRAIKYMLAESPKWRRREAGSTTIATGPVLSLAIEVACRCHVNEESETDRSRGVSIGLVHDEAARICANLAKAEAGKGVPPPDQLAARFINSHGLLLSSGQSQYKFAHRYFQEFLAGQHYAQGAHRVEAIARGVSTHWREPFRLMASFAGHEGENLFYILTLIDDLLHDTASPVASAQLAAEMLAEIGRRRLALRQFGYVLTDTDADSGAEGLWPRATRAVEKHVEDEGLTLAERERSAAVLAQLGDPRFVKPDGQPVDPWVNVVAVAGGTDTMGSGRLDPDTMVGGWVGDVRRLEFEPYGIGRFPVTNAEFRGFVEEDGYSNLDYWKGDLSRGWVGGDRDVLKTIREHWLATVYEHHAKEIRDGEIDTAKLEEESERRTAPRRTPYYWTDRRFNQANQPVVGVNWWEAAAFCEWATARGHRHGMLPGDRCIALPTEFEWEHASRPQPDDRVYPWGDEWFEDRAHVSTNLLNMRQPAPVGIYLEPWRTGPCDLSGNVWEWTASLFLPYSPEYDGRRLSAESLDERVVRGSSWYNMANLAACSARAVDRSYNLFYDVGFRIVVLHAESGRVGCIGKQTTSR